MNHFPATRSALLTELGRLRSDIAASRQGRANQLAIEQAMIAEAAEIERALIVDGAENEPPNAIVQDTAGAWWQASGDHIRRVPVAEDRKTIAGPAPERVIVPEFAKDSAWSFGCECDRCIELRAVTVRIADDPPVDLTDDSPEDQIRSVLNWTANVIDLDEIGDDGCGSAPVAATATSNIHGVGDC